MKIWIIGLVTFVAGAAAGFAGNVAICHQFGPWSGDPNRRASWMVRMLARDLQLSADQTTKLNLMKDEVLKKRTEMSGSRDEVHKLFIQEINADKINEKALNALFDSRNDEMRRSREFMISRFAAFHLMLSPEQRQTLAKKVDEFHKMHEPFF